ncbi:MAG: PAS domain-containing sensor histidine kinase, partial [Sphingomonadales bacterium]
MRQQTAIVVHGKVDAAGRLIEADPQLAELHARAGGEVRGSLAVPQIAALARLARRLGIVISRSVIAADGDEDLDLWVRARPQGAEVELAVTGWNARTARAPSDAPEGERETDFLRASADWMWETDASLCVTAVSPAAAAAIDRPPRDVVGKPLTRLFSLIEDSDGSLPLLSALAGQHRFDGQRAELRARKKGNFLLSGVPLLDGDGRFAGFRGSARSLPAETAAAPAVLAPQTQAGVDAAAFGERLDRALRGPLDHIVANAEAISAQPEGPLRRDYTGYARDIAAAGRHLLALVDDLVDLHAIERPDFAPEAEPVDLADIARRAAGLLAVRAAARNVRIDRPADDETLPSTGEFKRILEILVNLITNAIRYSP